MTKKPKPNASPLGGADDRPRMFVSPHSITPRSMGFRAESRIGGNSYGGVGRDVIEAIHYCFSAMPAGAIDGGMVIIIAEKGSIDNEQR